MAGPFRERVLINPVSNAPPRLTPVSSQKRRYIVCGRWGNRHSFRPFLFLLLLKSRTYKKNKTKRMFTLLLSSLGILPLGPTPQTLLALAGCALNLIELMALLAAGTEPGLSHPRALVSRLLVVFQEHLAQVADLETVA